MLRPYLELPRAIYILCLGTLINRAGTFLISFLTFYLKESLGFDTDFATFAMGVFGFGSIAAALTSGHLADRIGRRTVMVGSLLGASAILMFFGRLTSPWAIITAIFLFAFISDMYRPAAAAMIADIVEPVRRPAAYGLMYVTVNLGMAISPLVGGYIAEYSYQWLFYGDALTSSAYAAILFMAIRETLPKRSAAAAAGEPSHHESPGEHLSIGATALRILRDRPFVIFCLATHLIGITYMQSHTTLPLHLGSLGFGPRAYGQIVSVNAALIVLVQLPFTTYLLRFRREAVLVVSAVITAVGFGLTGLAVTGWQFVFTVVVWTIGEMMQSPYMQTTVADLAPKSLRGTYMGVFTMSFASALMVGSPVGGQILKHLGSGALWTACLLFGLTGAALYHSIRHDIRAPREAPIE
ncbi:MAG TPA: MFS transporter [Phycisphaerae bacterium]|nr:MFS transporter [Phycisphaerae bacterium]